MLSYRTATLLGSTFLFIGISLLLIREPALGPGLFPFYGLIILWSDLRREAEMPIIFLFLVSTAGLLLASRSAPGSGAGLSVEIAGIWLLTWALSWLRGRAFSDQREMAVEQISLEAEMKDDERDFKYYQSYEASVGGETRLRRDLAESAKSLGATMDASEVQRRLIAILASRFPGARITVAASVGDDALLDLASKRRGPVLVRDLRSDPRFKASGSAVAVPMKVMGRPAGFVRLESDQTGAFSPEDVNTADLFATMASLSLENITFFEQVNEQATHDPLTQLHSHKSFQARLQEELLRSGRSQSPLSLIFCDLDHFKSYNDRYGHQAGDHLLRTVAGILMGFARPVDCAARYGGEEFALIVPNFVRTEAVELANRIRARVASEPFVFQGQKTTITMSLGVASFPQDATTASQMVRVADERLYKAKSSGRNQVVG
ncbi:MAG: GGDEF domain-containing protein [Elusimicrobia bacterium]|nr:GGDEF domain-containing protein [Elusimicrobiota bacterium]